MGKNGPWIYSNLPMRSMRYIPAKRNCQVCHVNMTREYKDMYLHGSHGMLLQWWMERAYSCILLGMQDLVAIKISNIERGS
jgi:hypothetical protein